MIGRVCVALSACCAISAYAALPEPINVDGGAIAGTSSWGFGVRMFRGIPFAAPPVGQLRWHEPQPVVPWQGVRAADHFEPACMQQQRVVNQAAYNSAVNGYSEDCLYLNVWTPATAANAGLPVMVWIYGGGGREGSGGEALYDPNNLAKRGVVVVTFNYRVNLFGWMAHAELSKESAHRVSGNYGALDQIAVLRWVQKNIAAFGGDPKRVTIFGESGGSRSVNWLMASPLAQGLFHGAIAQSHTVFGNMETLSEAESAGAKFVAGLGANTLAKMRALPAKELMAAYLKTPGLSMNATIVDGYFLPKDIYTIFAEGKQNDVPLITGGTADEPGGIQRRNGAPKTLAEYQEFVRTAYGKDERRLFGYFPATSDEDVATAYHDLLRDGNLAGHYQWARLQTRTGKQPVYLYLFSHSSPNYAPDGKGELRIGAPHGADVAYAFDNLRYADRPWTELDRAVATTVANYWVNFAKTGNPNGAGLPEWPSYDAHGERYLDLGDEARAQKLKQAKALDFLAAKQREKRGEP